MQPHGLLLVDDHELLAQSLSWSLRAEGLPVTALPPRRFGEVLQAVDDVAPAMVLLDLDLGPLGSALPLIDPIRERGPVIVMLTGVTDRLRLAECLEAGASGLLDKSAPFDALLDGIHEALEIGALIPRRQREQLLAELRTHRCQRARELQAFERLSARERAVLAALVDGQPAESIAGASFVSMATVRSQIRAVLLKLGVNSQLAAVALARRAGWPETATAQR